MVGRFYVPPHWSQQLAPVVNQLMGGYYEGAAGRADKEATETSKKQAADWIGAVPTAKPGQVPFQAPGIDEADSAATSVGTSVQGMVQPEREAILKHALAGMSNPMTRDLASKYAQDQLINAPVREQEQKFKSAEAKAARDQRAAEHLVSLQAKRDEIQLRLEDRQLDRESRETLQRAMLDVQKSIAAAVDATRRYGIDENNQTRREIAEAKTAGGGKPVAVAVIKDLDGQRKQAEALENVYDKFKPEYGGVEGGIAGTVGAYLTKSTGGDKYREATDWWKEYENSAALVERHEKFGTALSAGEQAAWKRATIGPGMSADTIKQNLKIRSELANKVYNTSVSQYQNAGHDVSKAFPLRGQPAANTPANAPPVGTVKGGYMFKGGDPADKNNWEKQ